MIIKNKKNGTNVLAYRAGVETVRLIIRAGEQIDVPNLIDFNHIINKADFGNRGWFEIVNNSEVKIEEKKEESNFDKAEKEVKEYTSDKKKK